jgi:hypothetical protein
MGNSSSVAELPPGWEDILPNITREDILRSSHKNCRVEEDKSVYLDDDLFDLDEHVPMALEILRAAPHLKDIRFKLVPSTLTEERYWAALFGILQYGGIDIEHVAGKIDDDYETGDEGERFGKAQSPPEQPGKTKIILSNCSVLQIILTSSLVLLNLSSTQKNGPTMIIIMGLNQMQMPRTRPRFTWKKLKRSRLTYTGCRKVFGRRTTGRGSWPWNCTRNRKNGTTKTTMIVALAGR